MNTTTARFQRASRDDCTRCAESISGPYHLDTSTGELAVVVFSILGTVAVLGAIWMGWL